ncbi:MAG TPA: Rrf2 family transcriptional regulator [Selenomonadales bacterium]|nr:Rrf2 family transcriptional regulator [Selenomonadales bacterium]
MQLNQSTDYAFRAVLHMASLPAGCVVTGAAMAGQQMIPPRFVLKIMHMLSKAGIVSSHRGTGGGFSLAKPAEEISLYDVIVAMEGELAIHRCLGERNSCNKHCTEECPVHATLGRLQDQLIEGLKSTNFGALARERVDREQRSHYRE